MKKLLPLLTLMNVSWFGLVYAAPASSTVTSPTAIAATAPSAGVTAPTTVTTPTTELIIKPYTITVNGKKAQVYRIEQPDGTWGYRGTEGQMFNVVVKNATHVITVLHWHGLILPNSQDGVPGITQPPIMPGKTYAYHFPLVQAGTYWMHSHYAGQIQQQLSAPLIIDDPKAPKMPDAILFLSDFTFKSPEKILDGLQHDPNAMSNMHMSTDKNQMPNMTMSPGDSMAGMTMSPAPGKTGADLNDVDYDALLTNYRTLDNPDITQVKPGETIRLRIIDGGSGTNFFVNLGHLTGKLIAIDGEDIHPLQGHQFTVALGQRIDVLVTIPKQGAYPIVAQGEGTKLQTGMILATPGAAIPKLSQTAKEAAGAIGTSQELAAHALHPLKYRPIENVLHVVLTGNMSQYIWEINGKSWPDYTPLEVEHGQRVEIIFENHNGMAHPMHLHGHIFQVIAINGKKTDGALHDTILVPANGSMAVILDANNPGNWLLHCHVLYHQMAGMMTLMNYRGTPLPPKGTEGM